MDIEAEDRAAIEAWNRERRQASPPSPPPPPPPPRQSARPPRSSAPQPDGEETSSGAAPPPAEEPADEKNASPVPVTPAAEVAVPPSAPAAPAAAFSGSSSGSALWHSNNHDQLDNNDHYGFVLVRHSAMLDAGDTRASIRIDHENVFRNPTMGAGGPPDRRNSIRMERVTLELNRQLGPLSFQLTAGDMYAQLGRGLVLAIRRYDELGLDFAVRGGRLQVGAWQDRLTATALAGFTNINNVLPETEEFISDPGDRLAAAGLEARPTGWFTAGTQGALVTGGDPLDVNLDGIFDSREDNRRLNYSGSAEALVGPWSVGAEYARQVRRDDESPIERGSALFASASGPIGPLTVLLEYKDYRDYHQLNALSGTARDRILYSLSPTAERIDQEITNNTDVTGGRVRVDLPLGGDADTVLHASAGSFRYRFDALQVQHGFTGVRTRLRSGGSISGIGGYRRGRAVAGGALELSIVQFELDLLLPLTHRLGFHANVKPERVMKDGLPTYLRGTSLAELDWRARYAVGVGLDWTTESAALMAADPLPTYYPFALLRVRPSDSLTVQLFAGSQKGGLKCFGGVCRLVPPFAGARLDVAVRF